MFALNQGSTSYGRASTLSLNRPGGTFGSGHPAGGGAGAGKTLMEALVAPAQSVLGAPVIGPPPVSSYNEPVAPSQPQPQSPAASVTPTFHESLASTTPVHPIAGINPYKPTQAPGISPRFKYF